MCCPTEVEPTKETPFTSGCFRNISASFLLHVTMFKTPSGSPASCHSSAHLIAVIGVIEAALITIVLPLAMQRGVIHPIGIIPGKFHGIIPANTPSGSRYSTVSYPFDVSMRDSPIIMEGIPQASSMGSLIFSISPLASSQTLPFSRATMSVSSSICASRSSLNLKITWALFITGVCDHAGNAFFADSMAVLTSSTVQQGVCAITSPVLGSCISIYL